MYSFSEKPYSQLKPGQKSLDREYYKNVSTEQADGKVVLSNYTRFNSDYDKKFNDGVKKGDYNVPSKSANNMSK